MKNIFKALFLFQILIISFSGEGLTPVELGVFLLVLTLHIVRVRFFDTPYLLYLELLLASTAIYYQMPFALWYPVLAFDLARGGHYSGLLLIAAATYGISLYLAYPTMPLLIGLGIVMGVALRSAEEQSMRHQQSLDEERSLRYSLEEVKRKLLRTQDEISHIVEVKERNRIAHEIHDHVGHSIAGILVQLQVAQQVIKADSTKVEAIIDRCVPRLADTLTTLRATVHNLRPTEKPGIDYIRTIIDDFEFCPVEFKQSGNFSTLPPRFLENAVAILKESLTNTTKYSKASKVWVELDWNERFLRLYFRDNGVGCPRIKDGLGLSGMRERVANLGGSISVSGDNGFIIVVILYKPPATSRQLPGENTETRDSALPHRKLYDQLAEDNDKTLTPGR